MNEGSLRDPVIKILENRRIDARPMFYPIHLMPPYATAERFPIAEALSRRGSSLPTWVPMGDTEIRRVCVALREALA